MVKQNNKTCFVCQKKYTYCTSCGQYSSLPQWKNLFDTEDCLKIYQAVGDYKSGCISKETAIEKLKDCKIDNLNGFKPYYVESINELMKKEIVEETIEETVEPEIVEVKEETVIEKEQVIEPVQDGIVTSEFSPKKRKRK